MNIHRRLCTPPLMLTKSIVVNMDTTKNGEYTHHNEGRWRALEEN